MRIPSPQLRHYGDALNIVRNMRSAPHHATLQVVSADGGPAQGPWPPAQISGILSSSANTRQRFLAPQRGEAASGRRRWLVDEVIPPAA